MTDRLRDLQAKKGKAPASDAPLALDGDGGDIEMGRRAPSSRANEEDFMKDFYTKVQKVNTGMQKIKGNMQQMEDSHQAAINAVNPQIVKETTKQIDTLTSETNRVCGMIRDELKALDAESREFKKKNAETAPAEIKIRENMQNSLTKRFIELMKDYNDLQARHKKETRNRVQRQFEIVKPGVSQEEIDRVVESKESVFSQVMYAEAGHAQALSAYQEIEETHQAILRIERSIAELQQLFQDMAVLVEAQGHVIDQIEKNVSNAVAYTEKGVDELKKAEKYQKKARKKMCIAMIIFLGIITVLLFFIIKENGSNA